MFLGHARTDLLYACKFENIKEVQNNKEVQPKAPLISSSAQSFLYLQISLKTWAPQPARGKRETAPCLWCVRAFAEKAEDMVTSLPKMALYTIKKIKV